MPSLKIKNQSQNRETEHATKRTECRVDDATPRPSL